MYERETLPSYTDGLVASEDNYDTPQVQGHSGIKSSAKKDQVVGLVGPGCTDFGKSRLPCSLVAFHNGVQRSLSEATHRPNIHLHLGLVSYS